MQGGDGFGKGEGTARRHEALRLGAEEVLCGLPHNAHGWDHKGHKAGEKLAKNTWKLSEIERFCVDFMVDFGGPMLLGDLNE